MSGAEIMRTLAADYGRLKTTDWQKPPLTLCAVSVTRDGMAADRAAFEAVVEALGVSAGWARFRSETYASDERRAPPAYQEAGPPIAAEWAVSETRSVHVRPDPSPDGAGRLVSFEYAERPAAHETDLKDGERMLLCQELCVLRHPAPRTIAELRPKQRVLVYRVYWGASSDDPSAIARLFSRFAGFDDRATVIRPNRRT